jgi:cytochrome P450
VAATRDLTDSQRGELYLRLVQSVLGATGIALEWALIHAAEAMQRDPSVILDATTIAALVAETLRVSPVSWLIFREAIEDHRVGDQRIRADETVAVLTYQLHREPDAWHRPEVFDMTRWIGTHEAGPGTYVPFSSGRSTCPGKSIAIEAIVDATAAFVEASTSRPSSSERNTERAHPVRAARRRLGPDGSPSAVTAEQRQDRRPPSRTARGGGRVSKLLPATTN